ncbi:uncharacterized protein LOC111395256 [Olea europaea var. sylvestris]|uniref:uncharacterized protein LOC111395256 n=1 Tax=Olea europaea var. sylvestris TaxID=158386 RepID=UPI000C1D22AC|nr:uncharacterized protein LOC111395256 [Olea europaea var. sylvestris]
MGQLTIALTGKMPGNLSSNTEINSKEQAKAITTRSRVQLPKIHIKRPGVIKETSSPAEEEIVMPSYAKSLKDIISNKHKLEDHETIMLTGECSARIQKKLPSKLKDPGSYTVPCTIGEVYFDKALCDLDASINLMPLSVFRNLGLEEAKVTTVTLQLADRSLTHPRGIIEDVLIKLILRLGEEHISFNVFKAMKLPVESDSCYQVDIIDKAVQETFLLHNPSDA